MTPTLLLRFQHAYAHSTISKRILRTVKHAQTATATHGRQRRAGFTAVIRYGSRILIGAALFFGTTIIPSSLRADDFVKLGSPVDQPVNLYGVASVYERGNSLNPQGYKAWAVGELLQADGSSYSPSRGVLLFYNGTNWTKINIADDTPPLKSVAAYHYLRTNNEKGATVDPTWSTTAWAVGDKGTILRLDPYTNLWQVQKKLVEGSYGWGWRNCTEQELSNPQCKSWTMHTACTTNEKKPCDGDAQCGGGTCTVEVDSYDLLTVAIGAPEVVFIGGKDGAFYQFEDVYTTETNYHHWLSLTGFYLGTYELRGMAFTDKDHMWIVGTNEDPMNPEGYLWKRTPEEGINHAATFPNGDKPTSVTATLRSNATKTNEPLRSVVWIGMESGRIYRYDEAVTRDGVPGSSLVEVYRDPNGQPIRSVALSRRSGGQDENLIRNGTFDADRKDQDWVTGPWIGYYPDGWQLSSTYRSGRNDSTPSTGLATPSDLPGHGKAFVGESWQQLSDSSSLSGQGLQIHHFFANNLNYPIETVFNTMYWFDSSSPLLLRENDITPKILGSYYGLALPGKSPYGLGARFNGYIFIPNAGVGEYEFKVESPFGRAGLYIENDITAGNEKRCVGGPSDGTPCFNITDDCAPDGVCVDPTAYRSNPTPWSRAGKCAPSIGSPATDTYCYDDSECQWGSCSLVDTMRCKTDSDCRPNGTQYCDGTGTVAKGTVCNELSECGGGQCVLQTCSQWWANSKCVGASPTQSSQTVRMTFPAEGGVVARVCTNAGPTLNGRACITDEQCAGGTCALKGGNWYPMILAYYQANASRCSGNSRVPCIVKEDCSTAGAGTCMNQTGRVCNKGTNIGKTCLESSECLPNGSCVDVQAGRWCKEGSVGKVCASDADCGGAANSCVQQYDRTCPDTTTPCLTSSDCPDKGACTSKAATTPAPLKLWWRYPAGVGSWQEVPENYLKSQSTSNVRSSVAQEVPFSTFQGTSYKVSGKYKIEFNSALLSYQAGDPRRPSTAIAGVRSRCSSDELCGYDATLFESNPVIGVTNGTCSGDGSSCATDTECADRGAGTCTAGWKDFSVVVTKQSRSLSGVPTTNDSTQSLLVECFADVGARVWCDDIKVEPVVSIAQQQFDVADVWAVGDSGTVFRETIDFEKVAFPQLPAENWKQQQQLSDEPLRSVAATDPYHLWTVGDRVANPDQKASILQLSPGNVSGYLWIGTATSTTDPIGWVDLNCGNTGSCAVQPWNFGMNVDVENGRCAKDLRVGCAGDGECGGNGPCAFGVITGSAWAGGQDPTEVKDFGACMNLPAAAYCSKRYCGGSGDPEIDGQECTNSAECLPGTCLPSASCTVGGNDCQGEGNTCDYDLRCTGGVCAGDGNRVCANTGQCYGLCEKNQGIHCKADNDCKVQCGNNPIACQSIGWLSFDKSVAGTPPEPPYNDANQSYISRYHSATDIVDGWARFQLGQCKKAGTGSSNLACFENAGCPTGETCEYSLAYPGRGWVKLRSSPNATANYGFFNCTDCTEAAPDSEGRIDPDGGTCKICLNGGSSSAPTGNNCAGCTMKLCTRSDQSYGSIEACHDVRDCTDQDPSVSCASFGYCSPSGFDTGSPCFSDSDCPTGVKCQMSVNCGGCTDNASYGVSLDINQSKQFYGSAWSPDLGWLDFIGGRLGGQVYFQTKYGDIYSGGNIGTPSTPTAPGFSGAADTQLCNATYRIIAHGQITNFCSSAQPTPPAGTTVNPLESPYIQPGAPLYLLPTSDNQYTAEIGSLDLDGLTTIVDPITKLNKYGNVVVEAGTGSGDISLSTQVSGLECGSGPCSAKLLGRVYHIKGNLVIDKDYEFQVGEKVEIPTNPPVYEYTSGSGTFIIDGDLKISSNLDYYKQRQGSTASIAQRNQLPSVAFLAKGNIDIRPNVSMIVGAYYTEQNAIVESFSPSPDSKLVVYGLMVAQTFSFQRKYVSISDNQPEPAELVIYDGRLQTNTPPGLDQIAKSLPNVREVVP